jgi:hypothetical protein
MAEKVCQVPVTWIDDQRIEGENERLDSRHTTSVSGNGAGSEWRGASSSSRPEWVPLLRAALLDSSWRHHLKALDLIAPQLDEKDLAAVRTTLLSPFRSIPPK